MKWFVWPGNEEPRGTCNEMSDEYGTHRKETERQSVDGETRQWRDSPETQWKDAVERDKKDSG